LTDDIDVITPKSNFEILPFTDKTLENSQEKPLNESIESTNSDFMADHLMTNEEIMVEEISYQGKNEQLTTFEDCPEIPNEVNYSIEVSENIF